MYLIAEICYKVANLLFFSIPLNAPQGDCWICMELMDTSLDKFYKFICELEPENQLPHLPTPQRNRVPEAILAKITVATVHALNYLKQKLNIIHRDVKPSNILLHRRGDIKLCDFGISGQLVNSIARTKDAGCRPYMAVSMKNIEYYLNRLFVVVCTISSLLLYGFTACQEDSLYHVQTIALWTLVWYLLLLKIIVFLNLFGSL